MISNANLVAKIHCIFFFRFLIPNYRSTKSEHVILKFCLLIEKRKFIEPISLRTSCDRKFFLVYYID